VALVIAVCCAAAVQTTSAAGPSHGEPPPGAIYFPSLPSSEGLPPLDLGSMPVYTARTVPPILPAAYHGEPSASPDIGGIDAPATFRASVLSRPRSPAYFPTMPADFGAGAPLDLGSMPVYTARTVPPILPVAYHGEPSASPDVGEIDEPETFRASVLSRPQSPAYFPTMPADFGAGAPLYTGSPYSGSPAGYPGSPASYQQPLESSIPEPPAPFSVAPPPVTAARPRLRRLLRPSAPGWGAAVEFLMLTDGRRTEGPVLVRQVGTGTPHIASADLKGTHGVGERVTLTRFRSERTEFEFSYFGIYDWKRDAATTSNNSLELAGVVSLATFDYFDADMMTVIYRSSLNNLEFNWLQGLMAAESRKWVLGLRYLNWDEALHIQSLDLDSGTSDFRVDSSNDLLGFQAGVNQAVNTGLGETMVKLRGGLFHNMASQDTLIMDIDNLFSLRDVGASDSNLATMGEVGISHTFSPTDSVQFRFGYNMMWFEGLARAPRQVDLTDDAASSTRIYMDGSAFLHGASAGVGFRW